LLIAAEVYNITVAYNQGLLEKKWGRQEFSGMRQNLARIFHILRFVLTLKIMINF